MSNENTGVLVAGDLTIDLYPVDGPITPGSRFEWHIGGTATNAARWAASFGSDVGLLTNIGNDVIAEVAAQRLADGPVDTTHVTHVDAMSPLTMYVGADSEQHWNAWVTGSCYGFTPPTDPAALVSQYEWVHLEGVTLPAEVNQTAVQQLEAAAKASGASVSFDLNGRANQWGTSDAYRRVLQDVLQHCDLIFAGTDDLAVADVEQTPAGLLTLLPSAHSGMALITDGPAETTALMIDDGEVTEQVTSVPPAASVATTAGAGDAFAGAVLAARHDGISDLTELVKIGNAAGAACVSTTGPFDMRGLVHDENAW